MFTRTTLCLIASALSSHQQEVFVGSSAHPRRKKLIQSVHRRIGISPFHFEGDQHDDELELVGEYYEPPASV